MAAAEVPVLLGDLTEGLDRLQQFSRVSGPRTFSPPFLNRRAEEKGGGSRERGHGGDRDRQGAGEVLSFFLGFEVLKKPSWEKLKLR